MATTTKNRKVSDAELSEVFGALSNPTRLAILRWLREPVGFPPQDHPAQDVGVCLKHLQAKAKISQSTASHYLAVLQRAGLVRSTRIGQWTYYRRDDKRIARLADHCAIQL